MNKVVLLISMVAIVTDMWAQSQTSITVANRIYKTVDETGKGIAAQYPGDVGINQNKSVIFYEDFEEESMTEVLKNWTWNLGSSDSRLTLDTIHGPKGSPGLTSLKMTISRENGEKYAGSFLRKIFNKGYKQLFFRFYVKFADDYGFNHHFTSMSGVINPSPWPMGNAGQLHDKSFGSAIDQLTKNINKPGTGQPPPGYWCFYTYWPEMRSWQNLDGTPDGRPNPYYGNIFMPQHPVAAKRVEWQCVEVMIRLNSAPGKRDGAQAFWIDGKLAGHWDPKEENPVKGYWLRASFHNNPNHKDIGPFEGFKWNAFMDKEEFEKLNINIIKLQNYVSATSWKYADQYAKEHPEFKINLQEATVWKDHVVVATNYIGPIVPEN